VVVSEAIPKVIDELGCRGYRTKEHRFWINVQKPDSDLLIQFTTDARYQEFLDRATPAKVFRIPVKVAAVGDLIQAKVWAYTDPERRPAKRFKDAADIANLVEAFPQYLALVPAELRSELG
jgi:hypothetical protein